MEIKVKISKVDIAQDLLKSLETSVSEETYGFNIMKMPKPSIDLLISFEQLPFLKALLKREKNILKKQIKLDKFLLKNKEVLIKPIWDKKYFNDKIKKIKELKSWLNG